MWVSRHGRSAAGVGRKGGLMAKIVSALLIPWEPGVPGIAYELDDGYEGCVDGRFALTVPGLIQKLRFVDRREFEEQMRDAYADTGAKR